VITIEILCYNLIDNFENTCCTHAVISILARLIKTKKEKCKVFAKSLLREEFLLALINVIKHYFCNSIIMANLFSILNFLMEYMELSDVLKIISISKLRQIFCLFKNNGFDAIHENIILFIKAMFNKKDLSMIKPNNCHDLIYLFTNSFIFLRNKILLLDSYPLGKYVFQLMTNIYNITNILNNFDTKIANVIAKSCVDHKLIIWLSEIFYSLFEKQIISRIESCFESKLDLNLIATKSILLRTLYYCMNLIININELVPSGVFVSLLITLINNYN